MHTVAGWKVASFYMTIRSGLATTLGIEQSMRYRKSSLEQRAGFFRVLMPKAGMVAGSVTRALVTPAGFEIRTQ